MSAEKREKLALRYSELRARTMVLDPGDVDPREEVAKYGDGAEMIDPASPPPPPPDDANAAVRENAFKAYAEDGEQDWIMEPESTGSTGRFRLLTKFKGMWLFDEDETPSEHRVIVDLEWVTRKPPGWKGAKDAWKQWYVVTELAPKYHQDLIDEAGGIAETREAYIIDEDLYDMIIAARPGDQPRKVERKDAMEED